MDDIRVGRALRALRRRRGLRQLDLARQAGVSPSTVSLMERGRIEQLSVRSARKVAAAIEMRLPFDPQWRGGDLARLADAGHADLVESCTDRLQSRGWEVVNELTFNHFGERGSVDALAWHSTDAALLIVEVKTQIVDLQDLLAVLDRKARLLPALVRKERGWNPRSVGVLVVLPESGASRAAVARHRAIFAANFPSRAVEVRRWIDQPSSNLRGIWYLPAARVDGSHRRRVRLPRRKDAQ